jgi:hypothetical protein
VISFFLFGYILKMQYDGMILLLVRQYAIIMAVINATLAVYISLFTSSPVACIRGTLVG